MSVTTTADWALAYSRCGWRVFPLISGGKRPSYAGWQKDATTDPDLIRRYWAPGLDRNIGVVAGEAFDAWDIEVAHVPAFNEWLAREGHVLPEAPLASTGRGGLHLLTAPTGIGHTRKLYLDGTHIGELKSVGGFIAICPSVTEQMYRWLWTTERMTVPVAPQWLQGLVREPAKPVARTSWHKSSIAPQSDIAPLVKAVRDAKMGDRNAILHWAANRACDDGIGQEFATRELMQAFIEASRSNESRIEREHEAWATIASAYNR